MDDTEDLFDTIPSPPGCESPPSRPLFEALRRVECYRRAEENLREAAEGIRLLHRPLFRKPLGTTFAALSEHDREHKRDTLLRALRKTRELALAEAVAADVLRTVAASRREVELALRDVREVLSLDVSLPDATIVAAPDMKEQS